MAGAPKGNNNAGIGASIRDALRYEAARLGRELEGDEPALKKGLRALANPIIQKAMEGDLQAFREVADRIDGKPTQSIDLDANVEQDVSIGVRFYDGRD